MAAAPRPPLGSVVFDWAQLPVIPTPRGERRDFVDAPSATFRNLECHATTLNGGEIAHAPHRHPDEELVLVKEGELAITLNDETRTVGAGSLCFIASQDQHGLRNASATARVTYHVIRIITADTPR